MNELRERRDSREQGYRVPRIGSTTSRKPKRTVQDVGTLQRLFVYFHENEESALFHYHYDGCIRSQRMFDELIESEVRAEIRNLVCVYPSLPSTHTFRLDRIVLVQISASAIQRGILSDRAADSTVLDRQETEMQKREHGMSGAGHDSWCIFWYVKFNNY